MPKDTISVSEFKATCLAVIESVHRTGLPITITKFGVPVAELTPPKPAAKPENWLGCMAGTGKITGDLVAPAFDADEWDVLR